MAQNSQNHGDQRIAILKIQEARTTEEDTAQMEGVIPKIKIFTNGQYPSKMGVVFAINKSLFGTPKFVA